MIVTKHYNPVIVFSFSKRDCEGYALSVSKLDLNSKEEHSNVSKIFSNAISQLSETDRQLPQIEHILPLLQRGIGIHHSGLLPILKEVIEILFQEGLIKVLFATETFSIGLNMPAKTVVFTSVQKFDGTQTRYISGGEYIQMSGRAGRRGLDDRGIVIMMMEEEMDPEVAKRMVKGESDRLNSAFHLKYNMILNLLRVEGVSPEFMLERSFHQFQNQEAIPEFETVLDALKERIDASNIKGEEQVKEYYEMRQELTGYANEIRNTINHPDHVLSFINSGRLVHVKVNELDFGWGAVASLSRRPPGRIMTTYPPHESVLVNVLLWVSADSPVNLQKKGQPVLHPGIVPATNDKNGKMESITITLDSLHEIGSMKIVMPKELTAATQRWSVKKSIDEIKKRFPDGIALLDPVENMKIIDESFFTLLRKTEVLECRIYENPINASPDLAERYNAYAEKAALIEETKTIRSKLTNAKAQVQLDELRCRKRILRQLKFTTLDDVVELKGRVACEISSGDELVLTEMIFNGNFNDLTPEQCAALLSCFVFDEHSKEGLVLGPHLLEPYNAMIEIATHVAQVSQTCKLDINVKEYVEHFKNQLMDVVYHWCKGASFSQICKLTDVFEGSLIRLFRRLEELLRQMMEAARIIGNNALEEKMKTGMELIKRDLVSAASLYL